MKRLRGATVLLVKKVIQAVLVHMGLKGIGPQALTPLFRHLAGHHHAEIEARNVPSEQGRAEEHRPH